MSRTVTALFDTHADAEAGRERLLAADIDADNVRIHDNASAGTATDTYSTTKDTGLWASIKNAFLPDEDRHTYEEGVRRGGFLLTADVDEDEIEDAIRVLEESNGVDMDERLNAWTNDGWTATVAPTPKTDRNPAMFGGETNRTDESIAVNEHRLVVGQREVERGGIRARSYVTEVPVHEQVRLRNERIERERDPVDREEGSTDGNAFSERNMSSDAPATGTGIGNMAAGLGKEALGNVKQGLGSLTRNDDLRHSGEAQEREGEAQQGKSTDRNDY